MGGYLQCTMVGARVAARSLVCRTFDTNSTNSTVSAGVPWSGQDRYCIWVTSRSVPVSTSTSVKSRKLKLPSASWQGEENGLDVLMKIYIL